MLESETLDKTGWILAAGFTWDKCVYKQSIEKLQWILKEKCLSAVFFLIFIAAGNTRWDLRYRIKHFVFWILNTKENIKMKFF